nr:MFS transporter [Candidatus Sigynarchaeota archaeon]
MGFSRTFSGAIIGTGIAIFILIYWGSNLFSGVSASAIAVTYMFSPTICGKISDRIGRRRALLVATTGTFGCMVGYGLVSLLFLVKIASPNVFFLFLLIGLRMMEGIFNGFFWPVLQASVSDVSANASTNVEDYEQKTRAGMRVYNAGWNGGVLTGQLVLSLFVAFNILEICIFVPIFFTCFNCLVIFLYFAKKQGHVGNKGMKDLEKLSDTVNLNNNHDNALLFVTLGMAFILLYGLLLGAMNTTIVNYYTFIGIPMAVGLTEAARLSFQVIATSKIRFLHAIHAKVVASVVAIAGLMITMGLIVGSTGPLYIFLLFTCLDAFAGLFFGIIYSES